MTWQIIIFTLILLVVGFSFGAIYGLYSQRSVDMKLLKEQQNDLREVNNRIQEENAKLRDAVQSQDIKIGGF